MKNNRRLAILLCLTMLLCIIGLIPAFAAGTTQITFAEVSGRVGDEVTVPVSIANNPGIATMRFRVVYDMDALTFLSAEKGPVLTTGSLSAETDTENSFTTFLWYSTKNVTGDGDMVYLKFKITENARGDYPLEVTYLAEDLLNESWQEVPYTVKNGLISTGCSLTGTVESFGDAAEPVTMRLLEGNTELDSVQTTDGTYAFHSISPGTYTLEVSKLNHATRTYEITADREDITLAVKIHLMGDINGDGRANVIDVNRVFAHVKKTNLLTGYELLCANVAGSGATVNVVDVNRIFAHVKKTNLLW